MPTDPSAHRADLFRMVTLSDASVEVRAADATDGRIGTLTGYAALFNTDTIIDSWEGRFVERIAPKAFARTLEQRGDKVFFGATVDVEDEEGERATYIIVGEDEIDSSHGRISYKSPVGRALIGKRLGDTVTVRRPSGEVELSIVAVRYI
jgi:transcription elongation GreA/GreB family factor